MVVVVLTACPVGLRGFLTRWLLEIAPGVFCGKVSARVREEMWTRIVEMSKDGRALMVFSRRGDQGLDFRVHRADWEPVDYDGVSLIRRSEIAPTDTGLRAGWSAAAKRRRFQK